MSQVYCCPVIGAHSTRRQPRAHLTLRGGRSSWRKRLGSTAASILILVTVSLMLPATASSRARRSRSLSWGSSCGERDDELGDLQRELRRAGPPSEGEVVVADRIPGGAVDQGPLIVQGCGSAREPYRSLPHEPVPARVEYNQCSYLVRSSH